MNLKKSKEFDIHNVISNISRILAFANECFKYSKYFHTPKTLEEKNYISNSQDFMFIRHVLIRTSIIELYKIIKKESCENFNIFLFIDNLNNTETINKDKIIKWKKILDSNKLTIDQIKSLRNKIYAHTDNDYKSYINQNIDLNEIELIINSIELIIKDIYSTLDCDYQIDNLIFDESKFNIINILANKQDDIITYNNSYE